MALSVDVLEHSFDLVAPRGRREEEDGMGSKAAIGRRSAVGMILAVLLSVLVGTGSVGATTDQLDQSQPQHGRYGEGGQANKTDLAAQTFVAGITGGLDRVSVVVKIQYNNPGDLIVQIRSVDGSGAPTTTVLASTSVPQASIPGGDGTPFDYVDATFGSPAPVVKGTQYALVLSSVNGNENCYFYKPEPGLDQCRATTGMYYWALSPQEVEGGGNAYPNGTIWFSVQGGQWFRNDSRDFVFNTYVTVSDTTAPTTAASLVGTKGSNGYYTSAVMMTLTATDPDNKATDISTTYTLDGGATLPYTAPFTISGDGTHTVTYSSTDKAGNTEAAKSLTINIDTTPPTITATATPSSIWPPNHKMVAVSVAVSLTDSGSGADGFVLVSATASGDPSDLQGFVVGTASTSGQVRANKDEVYTLTYRGKDKAGNTATTVVTIAVPHDQGN